MNSSMRLWQSVAFAMLSGSVIGVNVLAAPTTINVALNKSTTVTSFNTTSTNGSKAVDGNTGTYWQTKKRSNLFDESITIDLGTTESISRVVLDWNSAYATEYEIRISTTLPSFTRVYKVRGENGGVDAIDFPAISGRYVTLYTRAWKDTRDRIQLKEMSVFRDDGLTPPPVSGGWNVVSSPNTNFLTDLRDVAVVDANNIWAVGVGESSSAPAAPMIQQWNGSQWSIVASPSPSANGDELYGVFAVSSTDGWAVGIANNRSTRINEHRALALHWDGISWFEVTTPDLPDVGEELRSVSALSSNAAYAVGATRLNTGYRKPLIMYWNGSYWDVIPNPSEFSNSDGMLLDVSAIGANDIWAVGYITSVVNNSSVTSPLAMHWNGSDWSVASLPNVATTPYADDYIGSTKFTSINALAANDIWAVGEAGSKTLTMHYDGSQWNVVNSPNNLSFQGNYLRGVTSVSSNDVWAVGLSRNSSVNAAGSPVYTYKTLTMHWDGSKWSLISTPNSGSFLYGVAKVNTNDVWSVGNTTDFYNRETSYILRYTTP